MRKIIGFSLLVCRPLKINLCCHLVISVLESTDENLFYLLHLYYHSNKYPENMLYFFNYLLF